ncbi:dienelactone hydrolase family protein [Verminephrobacter sp. Larva24]|nr:dienelactone hydrolase family protein [Verminephrobacter sp. Larva24]
MVPVLAHFGERDPWIALAGVQAFALAHPEVVVQTYPADHGFNCDQRGSYHEPSAVTAHDRTLAFLGQHLGAIAHPIDMGAMPPYRWGHRHP